MRLVARFLVEPSEVEKWLTEAELALTTLSAQPGFVAGELLASIDQPNLWLLTCDWQSVGDYRRALGSFEVKRDAMRLLYAAIDEPTAFEQIRKVEDGVMQRLTSARAADADQVGVRDAAEPNPPKRFS